jgi:hypothetical protein
MIYGKHGRPIMKKTKKEVEITTYEEKDQPFKLKVYDGKKVCVMGVAFSRSPQVIRLSHPSSSEEHQFESDEGLGGNMPRALLDKSKGDSAAGNSFNANGDVYELEVGFLYDHEGGAFKPSRVKLAAIEVPDESKERIAYQYMVWAEDCDPDVAPEDWNDLCATIVSLKTDS